MEPTYYMIGGDGKEYGPSSLAGLQTWIDQGRVTREMRIRRGDQAAWLAAEQYVELRWPPGSDAPPEAAAPGQVLPAPPAPAAAGAPRSLSPGDQAAIRAAVKSRAAWFFWIAGFSAFNSAAIWYRLNFYFVLGLGITQLFDVAGTRTGAAAGAVVLDLLVLGLFILFGAAAGKGSSKAFVAGMIVYALDAGLCALLQHWLNVAFHVYVLYQLHKGFKLNRLRLSLGSESR
jgi:hypothetical protein